MRLHCWHWPQTVRGRALSRSRPWEHSCQTGSLASLKSFLVVWSIELMIKLWPVTRDLDPGDWQNAHGAPNWNTLFARHRVGYLRFVRLEVLLSCFVRFVVRFLRCQRQRAYFQIIICSSCFHHFPLGRFAKWDQSAFLSGWQSKREAGGAPGSVQQRKFELRPKPPNKW